MVLDMHVDTIHLILLGLVTIVIMGTGLRLVCHLNCAFGASCLIVVGSMLFFGVSVLFLVAAEVHEREEAQETILSTLRQGDIEIVDTSKNLPEPGDYSVVSVRGDHSEIRRCFLFKQREGEILFHCPMTWEWSLQTPPVQVASSTPVDSHQGLR